MSSTPARKTGNLPNKTPSHWSRALGIFTGSKKRPSDDVEAGSNGTNAVTLNSNSNGYGRGGLFSGTGDSSPGLEEFQSPLPEEPSVRQLPNSSSKGSIGSSNHKTKMPRMELSMLPTHPMNDASAEETDDQKKMPAGANPVASPWHTANAHNATFAVGTKAATTAASPWHSRRARGGANRTVANPMATIVTNTRTSTARTKRYRPNSALLVGSRPIGRRYRLKTAGGRADFNPQAVSQALNSLKDSFLPLLPNEKSNVLSVAGRVHYGSSQFPTRLPKPGEKRQRMESHARVAHDDDSDDQQGKQKRQKTVSFEQSEGASPAVVRHVAATPAAKTSNRQGTPFPRSVPTIEESPATSGVKQLDTKSPSASSTSSGNRQSSFPDRRPSVKYSPDKPVVFQVPVSTRSESVPSPALGVATLQRNVTVTKGTSSYKNIKDWEASSCVPEETPARVKPPPKPENGDNGDEMEDNNEPRAKKSRLAGESEMDKEEEIPDWICSNSTCGHANNYKTNKCEMCQTARVLQGWGNTQLAGAGALKPGQWKCEKCYVLNEAQDDAQCRSCENPKPGATTRASNSASPAPTSQGSTPSAAIGTGGFTFQAPTSAASNEKAGFTFSAAAAPTPAANVASPHGNLFSSAKKDTVQGSNPNSFKFPALPVAAPENGGADAKKQAFSFGFAGSSTGASEPPAPAASSAPGENGDKGATSTGEKTEETGASAKGGFVFSAGSGATSAPAPAAFGSSAAGSASLVAPKADTTENNKKDDTSTVPAPAPLFVFGKNNNAPAPGPGPAPAPAPGTFAFGHTNPVAPTQSNAPAGVGESSKRQRENGTPSSTPLLFGGTAAATAPSGNNIFGSATSSATPSIPSFPSSGAAAAPAPPTGFGLTPAATGTSGGGSFPGSSNAAAPFASTPASTAPKFGSAQAPAMTFGSTPAPAPAMTFGSTPAPAPAITFGSTPAPAPATTFGAPAAGAVTTFGAAGTPAAPPMTFGAAGSTPAPAPMGFGAGAGTGTPAAFGAAAPAPPAFAATPQTAGGFGTAPFGSNTQQQAPGFGGAPSFGNAGGFGGVATPAAAPAAMGGFGGAQASGFPAAQTPAPTGGFGSFGATAPNTAPAGGAGFNIGSTGPKTTGRRKIRAKRPTRN